MNVTSVYPVLMTTDVAASSDFYQRVLGFEVTFSADWYVSMRTGVFELGLVGATHPTIPEGYRRPAAGLLVNIEVDDVDAAHRSAVDRGLRIVHPLTDEEWGVRRFFFEDAAGNIVNVLSHRRS